MKPYSIDLRKKVVESVMGDTADLGTDEPDSSAPDLQSLVRRYELVLGGDNGAPGSVTGVARSPVAQEPLADRRVKPVCAHEEVGPLFGAVGEERPHAPTFLLKAYARCAQPHRFVTQFSKQSLLQVGSVHGG